MWKKKIIGKFIEEEVKEKVKKKYQEIEQELDIRGKGLKEWVQTEVENNKRKEEELSDKLIIAEQWIDNNLEIAKALLRDAKRFEPNRNTPVELVLQRKLVGKGRRIFPFETKVLEDSKTYKIYHGAMAVYGIKFIGGIGSFQISFEGQVSRNFTVVGGEIYSLFDFAIFLLSEHSFSVQPMDAKSKLEYTLVGTGFNEPIVKEED